MRLLFLILYLLVFPLQSIAADWYVDGTMADDNGEGTSWTTAKKYISSGIRLMGGGDTLTIADGTYTSPLDRIANPPSGNHGADETHTTADDVYTTIKAETDFGVTLTGIAPQSRYGAIVYMKDRSYITIRGIKVFNVQPAQADGPGTPFSAEGTVDGGLAHHIKFVRCASDGQASSTHANGNVGSAFAIYAVHHTLFEECYSFGPGRYPFGVGDGSTGSRQQANYAVFRRNVQRWDWSDNYEVKASFSSYSQQHVAFQNNIVIDGKDIKGPRAGSYEGIKAFFTPNGSEGDITFDGNIVLNYEGAGYWIEEGPIDTTYLSNSIAWDVQGDGDTETYGPYLVAARYNNSTGSIGPFNVDNCTLGNSDYGRGIEFDLHGAADYTTSITDSIITSITLDAGVNAIEGSPTTYDYNYFYNNTGGRNKDGGVGSNSVTDTNPLTNGLLYLPRIETGSPLKTAGQGGGQVGAEVIYKIGRDSDGDGICGLLWGEEGWNELQNGTGKSDVRPLWPFPNESIIKTDMGAYYLASGKAFTGSPEIIGARGFASGYSLDGSPQTLTKYIWEYLGNDIPCAIYGTCGNPSSPQAPKHLFVVPSESEPSLSRPPSEIK